MQIATITQRVQWAGTWLEAGEYYLDDASAGSLLTQGKGRVRLETCDPVKMDHPNKVVVHPGGFGDLLWCNAAYERGGALVKHAAFAHYAPVLQGFAEVLPYPLPMEMTGGWPVVCLERVVTAGDTLGEHPADRFARALGVEVGPKKAAYLVTDAEQEAAREWWPRVPGKKRVAVQAQSSVALKSWPHLSELPAALWMAGCEVLIVGEPSGRRQPVPDGVLDATGAGLSIRESLSLAAECDLCVGADSVLIHAAHALDIPALGLFGPFAGAAYMRGYKGGWIQGMRECSPCGLDWEDKERPAHCERHCTALEAISAERVMRRIEGLLNTL